MLKMDFSLILACLFLHTSKAVIPIGINAGLTQGTSSYNFPSSTSGFIAVPSVQSVPAYSPETYHPPTDGYSQPGPTLNSYQAPQLNAFTPSQNPYQPPQDYYQPPRDPYHPSQDLYTPSQDTYQPSQDIYQPFQDTYQPSPSISSVPNYESPSSYNFPSESSHHLSHNPPQSNLGGGQFTSGLIPPRPGEPIQLAINPPPHASVHLPPAYNPLPTLPLQSLAPNYVDTNSVEDPFDPDDPFEPQAEVDFLPSGDPLLLGGGTKRETEGGRSISTAISHHTSNAITHHTSNSVEPILSSDLPTDSFDLKAGYSLNTGYKPLQISPGNQHLSSHQNSHLPAQTFTSPEGKVKSSSIQVAPLLPSRAIHQHIHPLPFQNQTKRDTDKSPEHPSQTSLPDKDYTFHPTLQNAVHIWKTLPPYVPPPGLPLPSPIYNSDFVKPHQRVAAYHTYKNQWTTSKDKPLVVDASKALEDYHNKRDAAPRDALDSASSVHYIDHNKDQFIYSHFLDGQPRPERDAVADQNSPNKMSFFTLGPDGPSMPFLGTLMNDMMSMMSQPILPKSGSDIRYTMQEVMHKMTNHYGDRQLDVFDYLPLFAILFASALIFSGLFPNAIYLAGQNLTFGRKEGRKEDETVLDRAISHLENGVLMMSAIRGGGDCAAKLACHLADVAKGENEDMLVDAVNFLIPNKYSNFTESFESVVRTNDRSVCSSECSRCMVL